MSWLSKTGMILGLVAVLVLVFVIGKANIINCQQVQRSIHGINDDRLVVMGVIDIAGRAPRIWPTAYFRRFLLHR